MGEVSYSSTYADIYLTYNNITPNILDNSTREVEILYGYLYALNDVYPRLIVFWIIFSIAFPGICFALYKLRSKVASVYVINLLISDLIQVFFNPIQTTAFYYHCWYRSGHRQAYSSENVHQYSELIYSFGVQVNILFMMCISAERYVMVAHAVWYRNIQNRKISVLVSVVIWILSAVICTISTFSTITLLYYVMYIILLLPYPLVMFFFVATWRALSRTSVPRNDQIRIRSILGLILCIYTILFIPYITCMFGIIYFDEGYISTAFILVALNPLSDLLLYVLIRREVSHVWRVPLFCCRGQGENIAHGSDTEI